MTCHNSPPMRGLFYAHGSYSLITFGCLPPAAGKSERFDTGKANVSSSASPLPGDRPRRSLISSFGSITILPSTLTLYSAADRSSAVSWSSSAPPSLSHVLQALNISPRLFNICGSADAPPNGTSCQVRPQPSPMDFSPKRGKRPRKVLKKAASQLKDDAADFKKLIEETL